LTADSSPESSGKDLRQERCSVAITSRARDSLLLIPRPTHQQQLIRNISIRAGRPGDQLPAALEVETKEQVDDDR
jgi:hypothetical protein